MTINRFRGSKVEIKLLLDKYLFTKRDLLISYRRLNHYEEIGLIDNMRVNKTKWRKFNGFDIIWISIIEKLRTFGVSIKNIKEFKNKLFEQGYMGSIDQANFIARSLKDEIIDAIYYDHKLYLLLFENMTYTFHDSSSLDQWSNQTYKDSSYINIPINDFILKLIKRVNQINPGLDHSS